VAVRGFEGGGGGGGWERLAGSSSGHAAADGIEGAPGATAPLIGRCCWRQADEEGTMDGMRNGAGALPAFERAAEEPMGAVAGCSGAELRPVS
jgi:hypothetical protein